MMSGAYGEIAGFEDLPLDPNSSWYGSDGSGGFTSGGAYFVNNFNMTFYSWDGFAYSNTTDTVTLDYSNQYSAITGGGAEGSATYAVAFDGMAAGFALASPTLTFAGPVEVSGAYFTNTTVGALAMRDGFAPGKKFGGESGNDPDWFKLTIWGLDNTGKPTDSVDLLLADYTFANNDLDYIVDSWTWLDMSHLGTVFGLSFNLTSSDTGAWGLNNPAYFALDNLSYTPVPEPITLGLLALGGTLNLRRKRLK